MMNTGITDQQKAEGNEVGIIQPHPTYLSILKLCRMGLYLLSLHPATFLMF